MTATHVAIQTQATPNYISETLQVNPGRKLPNLPTGFLVIPIGAMFERYQLRKGEIPAANPDLKRQHYFQP